MKTKRIKPVALLLALITFYGCNTPEEEVSVEKQVQFVDLDTDDYLLTAFKDEEASMSIEIHEPLNGDLVVVSSFSADVDPIQFNNYTNWLRDVNDHKLGIDQFYKRITKDKASAETVTLLKAAAERSRKIQEEFANAPRLSAEEVKANMELIDRSIRMHNQNSDFMKSSAIVSGARSTCSESGQPWNSLSFTREFINGVTATYVPPFTNYHGGDHFWGTGSYEERNNTMNELLTAYQILLYNRAIGSKVWGEVRTNLTSGSVLWYRASTPDDPGFWVLTITFISNQAAYRTGRIFPGNLDCQLGAFATYRQPKK